MSNFESSSSRNGMDVRHSISESESVDVDSTIISFDLKTEIKEAYRSEDWVAMYSFMGSHATPWT